MRLGLKDLGKLDKYMVNCLKIGVLRLNKYYGYAGKVLRIDLSRKKVKVDLLEKDLILGFIGGRGFNSKRLFDEVSRRVDSLSPENKLMFATGPLVGTAFPIGARFNVSAKSPLTRILGDSNAGGHFASELKFAGYDQIILEGKSEKPVYVFIKNGEVEILDASSIWGMDVYEVDEAIKRDLGDRRIQVACIGPAAERRVKYAGIFVNLVRAAGRTGMGTVMASKRVKAIAVKGEGFIEIANSRLFEEIVEELEEKVYNHPQYEPRRLMGTTRILKAVNLLGILPTRHFTSGVFEYADEVCGEKLAKEYNVKSRACFSCILPCSRFFVIRKGKYTGLYGEGPEYEPLSCFSARVGNPNLNVTLKAIDLVNRLGLDAISTAECISWAMELYSRGLLSKEEADGLDLSWGNEEAIMTLINKIAYREGFGDILADGVRVAADKLGRGQGLALHVKGLELIQADPRGLKGYGLGFAVASRGGDHLRSEPFIELSDDPRKGEIMFGIPEATLRLAYKGKGKLVCYYENWCAVIDALEVCKNIAENMEVLPFDKAAEAVKAVTGIEFTPLDMVKIGERIINIERAFLVREGVSRKDDLLPNRFIKEPMPNGSCKGSICELDSMLDEYYLERGWSIKDGIPKKEIKKLRVKVCR